MAVGGLHPRVHVRKGDMVEVIGGKHAGRRGKVLEVRRAEGRAIVEGVNIVKRHTKPNPRKGHQGGIMEIPAPLPAARLMVVCPRCGEASRMGRRVLGDGSRVRVCKHCGEQLDS
jgi:large subunit ribosomal protein L24